MLFLIHDHFIKTKMEYRKTPFLVTKRSQKSYPNIRYVFLISDPQVVGGFIAIFWLMAILWSKKLKSAKFRFWLQKGVKNLIRYAFLICDPDIVGGFICYFRLIIILSSQKLKNVKYRFWLQKAIKNSILQIFQTVGCFIYFFDSK